LEEVNDAVDAAHGQADATDQHLTAMPGSQLEIYVKCLTALQTEGLICSFK